MLGARSLLILAVMLLSATLPPAFTFGNSKPQVPADPWEIIHIARENGEAQVSRDKLRDPLILAEADDVAYEISFYDCHLGRNCKTVLFRAKLLNPDWRGEHPEIEIIDDWNAAKLFGRAILAESGHAILEHPVAMGPGMSRETMRATFRAWTRALEEFVDHVDFK